MNPRLLTRRPTLLSLGVTAAAAFALASKERRPVEGVRTTTRPDQDNISEKARAAFAEGGWNAWDPTKFPCSISDREIRPPGVRVAMFRNGRIRDAYMVGTFGKYSHVDYQVIAWK